VKKVKTLRKISLQLKIGICIIIVVTIFLCVFYPRNHLTTLWIDTVPLQVEVVNTPSALQKGLMERKELPDNQGMLFVFEKIDYHAFWMKNTYVPLAIAFISSDGQIMQIDSMAPLDTLNLHIS